MAAVGQSGDVVTFCSCLKGMRAVPPHEGVQTLEGHLRSERTGGKRTGQRERGRQNCCLLVRPVLGLRCPHQLTGSHTRTGLPLGGGKGRERLRKRGCGTRQSFC